MCCVASEECTLSSGRHGGRGTVLAVAGVLGRAIVVSVGVVVLERVGSKPGKSRRGLAFAVAVAAAFGGVDGCGPRGAP